MNEQSGRHLARVHLLLNLIEWHDNVFDGRVEQPQRQKRRRQLAGNCDADPVERGGTVPLCDHDGAVAVPHAGSVRQQDIAIGQMGVRVKRHRGDFVGSRERGAVQRFYIRQHVFEVEAA